MIYPVLIILSLIMIILTIPAFKEGLWCIAIFPLIGGIMGLLCGLGLIPQI